MDVQCSIDLPVEVANSFRCYVCQKYLSCGPIKGENGNLICGRCEVNSESAVIEVALEKIMANFMFPCCYDCFGCKERMLYNKSVAHEQNCHYRTVPCPASLNNACNANFSISSLYAHCTENHPNMINDGMFKINLDEDAGCNLIMHKDNVTLVVKYLYDSVTKCLQLEVASTLLTDGLVYYTMQIVSELVECVNLNFSEKQCGAYEDPTINACNSIKIQTERYVTLLCNPSCLIFQISSIRTAIPEGNHNDSNVLSVLDLSKFKDEASNLVSNLNHLFCKGCKKLSSTLYYDNYDKDFKVCQNCRKDIHTETFSDILYMNSRGICATKYSCYFKGCSFSSSCSQMLIKHAENCQHKPFESPFCKTYFLLKEKRKIIEHLKTYATFYPNNDKIVIKLYNDTDFSPVKKLNFTNIGNSFVFFRTEVSNGLKWYLEFNLSDHIEFRSL